MILSVWTWFCSLIKEIFSENQDCLSSADQNPDPTAISCVLVYLVLGLVDCDSMKYSYDVPILASTFHDSVDDNWQEIDWNMSQLSRCPVCINKKWQWLRNPENCRRSVFLKKTAQCCLVSLSIDLIVIQKADQSRKVYSFGWQECLVFFFGLLIRNDEHYRLMITICDFQSRRSMIQRDLTKMRQDMLCIISTYRYRIKV